MQVSGRLIGGLGNQLFILAASFGYAQSHGAECVIHVPSINASPHSTNRYENSVFEKIKKVAHPITNEYTEPYGSLLIHMSIPRYETNLLLLKGYFQNEGYFTEHRDALLNMITLPSVEPLLDTCFIHVRRNDYVSSPLHNIDLLTNYYPNAMRHVMSCCHPSCSKLRFVVFSDDIGWCKQQPIFKQCEFLQEDDEVRALALMASCERGGICANSTFSWWAAYLNKNQKKIVTFPDQWLNDPVHCNKNIAFYGSFTIPCTYVS